MPPPPDHRGTPRRLTAANNGLTAYRMTEHAPIETTQQYSLTRYYWPQPYPYRVGLLAFACVAGLLHWKGLNPLGLFYPSLGGSVSGANVKGAEQFEGLVRDSPCPESVLHPELPNFFQLRPQGAKKKQVFRPCALAFLINQIINRRTNYGEQIFSIRKKII